MHLNFAFKPDGFMNTNGRIQIRQLSQWWRPDIRGPMLNPRLTPNCYLIRAIQKYFDFIVTSITW